MLTGRRREQLPERMLWCSMCWCVVTYMVRWAGRSGVLWLRCDEFAHVSGGIKVGEQLARALIAA